MLHNKHLITLFKALTSFLTLLVLSSCHAAMVKSPETDKIAATPLSIDDLISQASDDRQQFFTDFNAFNSCRMSSTPTEDHAEPIWVEPSNVWQRIRIGYQLDHNIAQPRIDAEFNWYRSHPKYIERVTERAQRYLYHVVEQLEANDMPLELALLPIVESAFDPFAYSHGRAAGMWQFIPGTGRVYQLHQNWWYDGRRDVIDSTDGAIRYLQKLSDAFDGDWLLALAAYNSGRGTVNKAIRKNQKLGRPTDFWSLDLPKETRSYVPKLLAIAKLVSAPRLYGIELAPIPNRPYFAVVDTQSQLDLAKAAEMASLDIEEIYRLNPGLNRWATPPAGPHRLLVPAANAEILSRAISELPADQRLQWQRYKVKSGDSLLLLAKRFDTGADTIRQINGIKGNMIRAGQSLLIPTAAESGEHYKLSAEQRLAAVQRTRKGSAGTQQVFHTVVSGDSLWTIAKHYRVKVSDIARWNKMSPKDPLRPGQKLSVWTGQAVLGATTANGREPVVRKVGYKVRNGDSLALIASRFNVRINDIVRWNGINPSRYLQPGQKLTLFIDITNS